MNALMTGLERWNDISGRTSRPMFWRMFLEIQLLIFALMFGALVLRLLTHLDVSPVAVAVGLAMHLPWATAGVRRMHDVNMPGFFFFVPVAGLFFAMLQGHPAPNRYGPDPMGPL